MHAYWLNEVHVARVPFYGVKYRFEIVMLGAPVAFRITCAEPKSMVARVLASETESKVLFAFFAAPHANTMFEYDKKPHQLNFQHHFLLLLPPSSCCYLIVCHFAVQTDTSLHEFLDWFCRFAFPLLNVKRLFELVLNRFFSLLRGVMRTYNAMQNIAFVSRQKALYINGTKWYSSRELTWGDRYIGAEEECRIKSLNMSLPPPPPRRCVSCWTLCLSHYVTMGRFQGTWKENKHTNT